MFLKGLIVYFCDNCLHLIYNKKVIVKSLDSINQGLVVDRTSFMDSFLSILKKEKIKSKLFGDKIYVVKDVYFNNRDVYFLDNMFMELGFIKVVYLDIRDFFETDYSYIGIFKGYIVFYLDSPIILSLEYFNDFPKLIDYFKDHYKKYIVLFGSNTNIPLIHSNLVSIYYIDQFQSYIAESLLKVKKYGA